MFVPLKGTPTWRHQKIFLNLGKAFFPNISHMKYRTDLIPGEAFCIFILFNFQILDFLHLTVCIFFNSIFDGVTVKIDSFETREWIKVDWKEKGNISRNPWLA